MGEPCAGLVDCWGGGGDLRKPQLRMLGIPPALGKTEALPAPGGSGESRWDRSCCPRLVGLLGATSPPPRMSACGGEGLDRAPLAVLLGVGVQALWLAAKEGSGWPRSPPAQGPTLRASPAQD